MNRLATAIVGLSVCAVASTAVSAATTWQLTMADEFDGTSLNTALWNDMPRWGNDPINNELQAYRPGGVSVSGGMLHLTATRLTTPFNFKGVNYWYQSGEIQTHQKFAQEYGKFEIRCKAPVGKGLWPAFWLLPEDVSWPPEVDVFEILGNSEYQTQAHFGYIMPGTGNPGDGTWWTKAGYRIDDFHTYAVEWDASSIKWLVDGQQAFSSSRVGDPGKPMYLIANLAVGGNWPGAPDASTAFPSELTVDYIRVYTPVVPEPSTCALLLIAALPALGRRKRDTAA